jgi:hypothetical protein
MQQRGFKTSKPLPMAFDWIDVGALSGHLTIWRSEQTGSVCRAVIQPSNA